MTARLQIPRTLFVALFTATIVLLVVLLTVKLPDSGPQSPMLPPVLALVSLGVLAVSFVLPARQLAMGLAGSNLAITEEPDPGASEVIPYRDAPKRRVFADPQRAVARAFGLYVPKFILEMALSEAVALFGFVVGYLGHPPIMFLPFFALSWLAMAARFPTLGKVIGPLERAFDARLPLDGL